MNIYSVGHFKGRKTTHLFDSVDYIPSHHSTLSGTTFYWIEAPQSLLASLEIVSWRFR